MEYEVGESATNPGYYSAEAVNYDGDGEIYVTLFLGPRSRERAEEFAAWKNQRVPERRPVLSAASR